MQPVVGAFAGCAAITAETEILNVPLVLPLVETLAEAAEGLRHPEVP